jgi:threonine/homoserine/homoserine lactone efflux protein
MTLSPLANSYILGWSVAWPPGPINAEMIRRGLPPKDRRGGFWSAWPIGLGACTGDFIWAFGVSVGAGALLNSVGIRRVLAIVSLALLVFLGFVSPLGRGKSITGIAVSSFKRQKANDTAISYLVFLWC